MLWSTLTHDSRDALIVCKDLRDALIVCKDLRDALIVYKDLRDALVISNAHGHNHHTIQVRPSPSQIYYPTPMTSVMPQYTTHVLPPQWPLPTRYPLIYIIILYVIYSVIYVMCRYLMDITTDTLSSDLYYYFVCYL